MGVTRPVSGLQVTPELLLADWNYWRELTQHVDELRRAGKFVAQIKGKTKKGDDRLAKFQELIDWCNERSLDPRYWVYCLFAMRRWIFPPQIPHLLPKDSRKAMKAYQENRDLAAWSRRLREEAHLKRAAAGEVYDRNRDVVGTVEAYKKRHLLLAGPASCMGAMRSETFGFHPKSEVCASCPGQGVCAEEVRHQYGFDVVAYRRGEMTDRQAQELAASSRQRGVHR